MSKIEDFLEKLEIERKARLEEIKNNPIFLSIGHRPGNVQVRNNPNSDSDCDYFICPGCATEVYSSWVSAWAGIKCNKCGCTFACTDESGGEWDFDELPTKRIEE